MGSWKNHVRAGLQQRDQTEKVPYDGVFTRLSQLEERFEIRKQILEDVQAKSFERGGVEVGKVSRLLQLQLRESEHLAEKLSQTVSDLTTVLYLKEAKLQHWQSRVSHYCQEALTLAKGSKTLRATLSEFESTIECQSKELEGLRAEQKGLKEALTRACREKEELLQRWMEEKREEADRLNKYNDAQERWQRMAKQVKKHLRRETGKDCDPTREISPSIVQMFALVVKLDSVCACVCGGIGHSVDFSHCVKMVKGGKRYSSMSNDGKWFAHLVSPKNETRNRETCTSTGIMLTQVNSSLPQALNFERYPKWKTRQESREYPLSDHDNKHALKDNISVFTRDGTIFLAYCLGILQGVGRRKCLDYERQHSSHFCLCHDGAYSSTEGMWGNVTAYQTDFTVKQPVNGPTSTRRFPHNHKQKSAEAALALAGEQFMWFGRHDSNF
ncbi:hypothetical protein L3Q82_011929 [Scortum barcoo]|uniref:Uncharacterized protein n=1 Tax=Scortum barcoo TaxID=214431 RepID=A0ACB8W6L9_9TELE|nr:hypothetical protein L3Q82_011929 [Scortum barcoo]